MSEDGSLSLRSLAPNSQVVIVFGVIAALWLVYMMQVNQMRLIREVRYLRHTVNRAAQATIQPTETEMEEEPDESEADEGNSSLE